jgi:hypothetical protein
MPEMIPDGFEGDALGDQVSGTGVAQRVRASMGGSNPERLQPRTDHP